MNRFKPLKSSSEEENFSDFERTQKANSSYDEQSTGDTERQGRYKCVFIENIDPTTKALKLKKILMKYGNIQDFEMPKEPAGKKKNLRALVRFETQKEAEKAQEALNGYFIKNKLKATLRRSSHRRTIASSVFIRNLNLNVEREDLIEIFDGYGKIAICNIKRPLGGKEGTNYSFLHYEDKVDVQKVIRETDGLMLKGIHLRVHEYVNPKNRENSRDVTLFFRNFPFSWTDNDIWEFIHDEFEAHYQISHKNVLKKKYDDSYYCFVGFKNPDAAEEVFQNNKGRRLDPHADSTLFVDFYDHKKKEKHRYAEDDDYYDDYDDYYEEDYKDRVKARKKFSEDFDLGWDEPEEKPEKKSVKELIDQLDDKEESNKENKVNKSAKKEVNETQYDDTQYDITTQEIHLHTKEPSGPAWPIAKFISNVKDSRIKILAIKKRKPEFLKLQLKQQKFILFKLLFERVREKHNGEELDSSAITAYLTDFSLFNVDEIIEMIEDTSLLVEEIKNVIIL